MDYAYHVVIVCCIYVILAVSQDLLVGHGGLVSLSQAAFFGVGAYTSAIMTTVHEYPFGLALLGAVSATVCLSQLMAVPSLRLRDDYFVLLTFSLQMIVASLLANWVTVTGGHGGLAGIPRPAIFGISLDSKLSFVVLTGCVAAATVWIVGRIAESPFGRVLHALRESSSLVETAGKNPTLFRSITFAVTAAFAAVAGCIYAHYTSYIEPTGFGAPESILIVSMVILGGAASRWGPVVGAVTLVVLPEVLRFVGFPMAVAANVRQIVYGLLLVALMLYRPQGLFGNFDFSKSNGRS